MDLEALVKVAAPVIGVLWFSFGVWQYTKAQRWKKAEFASKEIEKLLSNEILVLACQMLDWERGKSKVPAKFKDTSNNNDDFEYNWAWYERAMHASVDGPDGRGYSENERYCRVIFDDLFTFFNILNHYISVDLIRIEDIRPIEYWTDQIFKSQLTNNNNLFTPYLEKFGYTGVTQLHQRFKSIPN